MTDSTDDVDWYDGGGESESEFFDRMENDLKKALKEIRDLRVRVAKLEASDEE